MLAPKHREELLQSAISPEIIDLNFKSLDRDDPLEYLLYGLPDKERRNDGRIRERWLKSLKHTYHGGWWCSGVDVVNDCDALWGQFKSDRPRKIYSENKIIKYEAPRKVSTEIYALKIPRHLALEIGKRSRLALEVAISIDDKEQAAIDFWNAVKRCPEIPLLITEGAKKAGALLSAGHAAIALPGIYSGYRQPKDSEGNKTAQPALIPQLQILAKQGRQIYFVFDSDAKASTRQAVRTAISKTGKLLEQRGAECKVVRWDFLPNAPKGVDDLIIQHGQEYFQQLLDKAVLLSDYNLEQLTDLSPYVNETLDSRYLDIPWIDPEAQVIGLKSAKGTGKTRLLEFIVRDAQRKGQRTLVLTHRVQLAKSLCDRLGIDHVDDFRTSDTRGSLGMGLCVDSMRRYSKARFNPEEWHNSLIVLDEVEQVVWHMLSSSTCQKDRVEILQNFQATLQIALSSGGKVILSDADLSPISLKFVEQLLGFPVKSHIIENRHIPNAGKRDLHVYKSPAAVLSRAEYDLMAGRKIFISLGAQKEESTWSTINIETELSSIFDSSRILRIDAETISNPTHPAYCCIDHINEIIANYDCVLASPTIETGVSIDLRGHFDNVYGIFHGVQTVDAAAQALERVRDDCDRHIFVNTKGLGYIGRGETNLKQLLRSTHQEVQANMSCLQKADMTSITLDNVDTTYQQSSLIAWAKRAVVVNTGMKQYRRSLLDKLEREGYKIIDAGNPDPSEASQIKENMKAIKEVAYEEKKQNIAGAQPLSEHEVKQLEKKKALTKEQRYQLRKAKLEKIYGCIATPELVQKDDDGWYGQLRLHYYLTIGRLALAKREEQSLKSLLYQVTTENDTKQALFKPDAAKKLIFARIRGLELLNIPLLFDLNQEHSDESLSNWRDKLIQHRWEIYQLFGIRVTEKTGAVTLAQSFLKLFGLTLGCLGRFGSRGDRQRIYKLFDLNPDGRDQVFAHWLKRDGILNEEMPPCPAVS